MTIHAAADTIATSIEQADILVTAGAGGVGKTTTAAAIGLAAALRGRRVLVMTIDPARRLAQSMGLETLDHEIREVDLGVPTDGALFASMLDMQTTFDELIDRHARTPEAAAAIRANRIYRTLSSTLSGTQEYMAMERLYELHTSGEWDLVVVDTPPTRSALDFLEAPGRMTGFLEGRLLKVLLKPAMLTGKGFSKFVGAGATAFMNLAGKVTGMDLLTDLAEFFRNFDGMYEGFKQRADAVLATLQRPSSRFVIVTSAQGPPLNEAKFFLDRLEQEGLHAAGVVVNRIQPEILGAPGEVALASAADDLDAAQPEMAGVLRVLGDVRRVAERERGLVDAAFYGRHLAALVEVPLLRGDVHDLEGLRAIADTLAPPSAEGSAP